MARMRRRSDFDEKGFEIKTDYEVIDLTNEVRPTRRKEPRSVWFQSRVNGANQAAKKMRIDDRITGEDWEAVLTAFGDKCLCCGNQPVTIDHVVPLSLGGKNARSNLQPLCKLCNAKKGTQIIDYRVSL